jgi:hypothetical protein
MAGWLNSRGADSAAQRDPSYSTSRRASPRGLGYFYSTTWEAASLNSISGHILQDDPSIREEVLDSRLGGSVPRVLRFFLRIFRDFSCQDFRWTLSQSLRLNLRLGGYSIWSAILRIAPPYQLRLQDKIGSFSRPSEAVLEDAWDYSRRFQDCSNISWSTFQPRDASTTLEDF